MLKSQGYNPLDVYHSNPELKAVIDLIADGYFSGGDRELFRPLVNSLLQGDPYCCWLISSPLLIVKAR